jgi:hypothetical protein
VKREVTSRQDPKTEDRPHRRRGRVVYVVEHRCGHASPKQMQAAEEKLLAALASLLKEDANDRAA